MLRKKQLKALFTTLCAGVLLAGLIHAATFTWTGAASADWHTAANWDQSAIPGADADVIVNTGADILLSDTTANLATLTMNGGSLTFSNWTTRLTADIITLNAGEITCAGPFLSFTNYYWPELIPSNRVSIACDSLTIGATAVIDVSGKGYYGGSYDNTSNVFITAHGPGGGGRYNGGGHAAAGGRNSAPPYGDYLWPKTAGSGGGVEYFIRSRPEYEFWENGYIAPGFGGGVVEIIATGTVTVDGEIKANGLKGIVSGCGGGAGGSIAIQCETIAGSGRISAEGETGGGSGGCGSGGRISIQYNPAAQSAFALPDLTFSAFSPPHPLYPRNYNHAYASRIGTLCFPDDRFFTSPIRHNGILIPTNPSPSLAFSSLEASNVWFQIGTDGLALSVTNEIRVYNNGRFEVTNAIVTCSGLTITNFGTFDLYAGSTSSSALFVSSNLYMSDDAYIGVYSDSAAIAAVHGALIEIGENIDLSDNAWIYPFSHLTNAASALFKCRNLTISANAGFNADYLGCLNGPGSPTTDFPGAGYGGKGGDSSVSGRAGGEPYGDALRPVHCGSGYPVYSHHGGGLVRVEADYKMTINGEILCRGENASKYAGGSSGGGIYLVCRKFTGSGALLASGSNGGSDSRTGGGGGGRIAVWYGEPYRPGTPERLINISESVPPELTITADVHGGTGRYENGEDGTIRFIEILPPPGTRIILR